MKKLKRDRRPPLGAAAAYSMLSPFVPRPLWKLRLRRHGVDPDAFIALVVSGRNSEASAMYMREWRA